MAAPGGWSLSYLDSPGRWSRDVRYIGSALYLSALCGNRWAALRNRITEANSAKRELLNRIHAPGRLGSPDAAATQWQEYLGVRFCAAGQDRSQPRWAPGIGSVSKPGLSVRPPDGRRRSPDAGPQRTCGFGEAIDGCRRGFCELGRFGKDYFLVAGLNLLSAASFRS